MRIKCVSKMIGQVDLDTSYYHHL